MEGSNRAAFCKNKMEEEVPRFALLEGLIDDFIDEQEKKKHGDVSLLKPFLQRRLELRKVEEIT